MKEAFSESIDSVRFRMNFAKEWREKLRLRIVDAINAAIDEAIEKWREIDRE